MSDVTREGAEAADAVGAGPLVLLHGFPFDASMWDDVVELLGERDVPTLAADAPGFGASDVPDGEPSLDVAADALLAVLDDLGLERVVLAGLSMGGYIAMAFAARHGSRLAGLALLDTKAGTDTEAALANRYRVAEAAERGEGAEAVAGMIDVLLGETTRANEPDVVERHRSWLAEAPDAGIAWGQLAMAARPSRFEVLEDLEVPALVVRGSEDALSTQADAEAMVHALLAHDGDAELVVIPGAGHMTATEDPEAVADALETFWRRCTGT